MKSVAETDLFNGEEKLALYLAQRAIKAVIEPEGVRYRCHEIARAVAAQRFVFGTVEDGNCLGVEHSWIRLGTGNILDPYVMARLPMVQLVNVRSPTLQRDLYRVEPMRTDIDIVLVAALALVMGETASERSIIIGLDIGSGPDRTCVQKIVMCSVCGLRPVNIATGSDTCGICLASQ